MIRKILVPLDPSEYSQSALRYACRLANEHSAELTGIVVLDRPGIWQSIGMVPVGSLHYATSLETYLESDAKTRIESLLIKFQETCEAAGVAHRESEYQGSPARVITTESGYFDLVVIGMRTFFHFETSIKPGDSLESLLDHSPSPVIAVPIMASQEITSNYRKVLIAFDGSISSCKALHRFVEIIKPSNVEVTLFTADNDKEETYYKMNKAENYLNKFLFMDIIKDWQALDVMQVLGSGYAENFDMVVTGAHSKRALIDFMVGSVPRHLIEASKIPVLIGM